MTFLHFLRRSAVLLAALTAMTLSAVASEDVTPDIALSEPAAGIGNHSLDIVSAEAVPKLAYFASRRLDATAIDARDANVLDALIVVHGIRRDAGAYFETAMSAAQLAGQDAASTLILAPQYLSPRDVRVAGAGNKFLVWNGGSWSEGGEAGGPGRAISSFATLDAMVGVLADRQRFPQLRRIVITGHSAGGQMVHRYAIANQIDERVRKLGVALRYVIANPSTYLYLTADRIGESGRFSAPSTRQCPDFDRYRYGLTQPNRYVAAHSRERLIETYAERDVVYLLGERDIDANHPALDKQCPAALQGVNRLDRGVTYVAYLTNLYGASILETQRLIVVPQIGHDQTGMYTSPCGLQVLFGSGKC